MDSHFLDDCGFEGHNHLDNELSFAKIISTQQVTEMGIS